jgi:hypothetical protein
MAYPKTWYQEALDRGAKENPDGTMGGRELERVGIAIINGCPGCGATVAAFNSYMTAEDNPYMWCADCAGVTRESYNG